MFLPVNGKSDYFSFSFSNFNTKMYFNIFNFHVVFRFFFLIMKSFLIVFVINNKTAV